MRMANKPVERTATERCDFDLPLRQTAVVAVASALPVAVAHLGRSTMLTLITVSRRKLAWTSLLAVIACTVAGTLDASEVKYKGLPISAWFERLPSPAIEFPATNEAIVAFRSMGTNAIPFLLRSLATGETNVTAWKAIDGFYCLGDAARPAIPELSKMLHDERCKKPASESLGMLFCQEGFAALSGGLTDSNAYVRWSSAIGLSFPAQYLGRATNDQSVLRFQREARVAIPGLLAALQRQDTSKVHVAIIMALADIRQSSEAVIPALRHVIADADRPISEQRAAAKALVAFGVSESATR